MRLAYKNPNPPILQAFAVSKVETSPNERTYYAVFPQGSNYFTIQDGHKFSMRQFFGGTN
jgi:hypothetical protein